MHTSGSAASRRRPGRSPSTAQAANGDDDDLQVAEHGREAGADVGDRVVPEDQVGGEEDAGDAAPAAARGAAARPVAAASSQASSPSTGSAYAQRKIAAVEARRRHFTRIAENAIVSAPATAAGPGSNT